MGRSQHPFPFLLVMLVRHRDVCTAPFKHHSCSPNLWRISFSADNLDLVQQYVDLLPVARGMFFNVLTLRIKS
jgi:hypothetical protein